VFTVEPVSRVDLPSDFGSLPKGHLELGTGNQGYFRDYQRKDQDWRGRSRQDWVANMANLFDSFAL
jgi:hypothetical protein